MIQPRKILKRGKQQNQNQETVTPDTKLRRSPQKQPPVLVESPISANKASPMVDATDYRQQTITNYFRPVDKEDKLVIRSSKISALKTTVSKMEKRHKELTGQIEQLKKENKELQNKLKEIEKKTKTNKLTNQAPEKSKQQKSSPITAHGMKKQQSQPLETSKKRLETRSRKPRNNNSNNQSTNNNNILKVTNKGEKNSQFDRKTS